MQEALMALQFGDTAPDYEAQTTEAAAAMPPSTVPCSTKGPPRSDNHFGRHAMKQIVRAIVLLLALTCLAQAQDKITLQLKWLPQAQFAGYYVAKDKGFYRELGLDVTIKPGGPDIDPSQVVADGGADVGVD
jgi:hypothetical protein